jgi:hypothetical protein
MQIVKAVRKLMFAALAIGGLTPAAHAGTDTLVSFSNFSPYTVEVSFPPSFQECWHDDGADATAAGRIFEYRQNYIGEIASNDSYLPFLKLYKKTFNLADIGFVPTTSMVNARQAMAPARDGQPLQRIAFRGETSAEYFNDAALNCKTQISSRGFVVKMTDASGTVVSKRHYVITDPPESEWTLTRLAQIEAGSAFDLTPKISSGVAEQTIMLGGGGRTSATEVVLSVGTVALTIASIGEAYVETKLARSIQAYWNYWREEVPGLARTFRVSEFMFGGGVKYIGPGVSEITWGSKRITNYANRVITSTVSQGILYYYGGSLEQAAKKDTTISHFQPDFSPSVVDLKSPLLYVNAGLVKDRSVCILQGSTLGITECHLVGIELAVLPDGSISFVPLPSVGGGWRERYL